MSKRVVVLALALGWIPALAGASQWYKATAGSTDRSWLANSKAANDNIVFAWVRDLPTSQTAYFAVGECFRATDDGQLVGSNKVSFRNLYLLGADSESEADLPAKRRRMKKGLATVAWDITDLVHRRFAGDSWLIVAGEVAVTGSVKGYESLLCTIGTVEILDSYSLLASSTEDRLRFFRQLHRQRGGRWTDAPRPAAAADAE